ncbi:hypothetical protein OBBRIDRAFT_566446 [Obba rivulosa]|uniref:Uncharacterized protein n=1 Tax=Obba rivulosa TaxID=1052685 RepID=A0A8E2AQW2_9APHY|nr:hypothetical protein OBBRIDRAFT_566446 [Obba rivulosa]
MHCNPAGFPELYNDQHEWYFNSSVAEQINAWFGKFQAVTREMAEVRYNFFLDEMIAIRNDWVVQELFKAHQQPHLIPLAELVQP